MKINYNKLSVDVVLFNVEDVVVNLQGSSEITTTEHDVEIDYD